MSFFTKIKRRLKAKLLSFLKFAYYIGIIEERDIIDDDREISSKIRWIKCDETAKNEWYADPFLLEVTGENIIVLVEEMVCREHKGRLSKLIISRKDLSIIDKKVILEKENHLSFPIFIRENENVYVYPENYQSGCLALYELKDDELKYKRTLVNEPLVDAQIFFFQDEYYLFGTNNKTGNLADTKTLCIYKSKSLNDEFKPFQIIENQKCEERGAGRIYEDRQGRIIRPAQCCEGGYGKAVILYELKYQDDKFNEIEIGRIVPDATSLKGNQLHTWNYMSGYYVVDGMRIFHPYRNRIYGFLRKMI